MERRERIFVERRSEASGGGAMKIKSGSGRSSRAVDAGGGREGMFSRPLVVDDLPDAGLEVAIRAKPDECEAMAERDGLEAISSLEADLRVTKQGRAGCNVSGILRANVAQICVVSLDPFETAIRADIDVDFAPAAAGAPESLRARPDIAADGDLAGLFSKQSEPPDPIVDGRIDLGAVVEEFLVLSLDPYPRKPGARFDEDAADPVEKISPFAVLRKLKEGS
jgi:hypothetical protein